jgi:hypothetical protein
MFARQVRLARGISRFLHGSPDYTLLPHYPLPVSDDEKLASGHEFENTHIIVLFRAKDEKVNDELVSRINSTRKMYVSGTKWGSKPACRVAISTWKVDVERDLKLVKEVLNEAPNGGL